MIDPHALRTLIEQWRDFSTKPIGVNCAAGYDGITATLSKCADELASVLSALPETPAQVIGTWPEHCEQRAFVEGAKWYLLQTIGATMFPTERDDAEEAAIERYGPVAPPSLSEEPK